MATVTLTNMLTVSDMKSGWALEGVAEPCGYGGGYSILLEGPTTAKEKTVATTGTWPLNNTHVYYVRWYGYQETRNDVDTTGIYWPIAEPYFVEAIPNKAVGDFQMYSFVNHRNSFTNGNYAFRIDYNNNFVAGTMYVSAPMLIDLTAAFGAGKEPTCEWMDEHIPYFTGSKSFNSDLWELVDITPTMTSNTTPSGYVASASSEVTVPRQAWCAFDGVSAPDQEIRRWHSGQNLPVWLMLKFPDKHKVEAFSILNATDPHYGIGSFQLQGSNDGSNFTTLGTYSNPKGWGVTTIYEVANPGYYQYYRIYVTSTQHTAAYAIIDEVRFFEKGGLPAFAKVGGAWVQADAVLVKSDGSWAPVTEARAKSNGAWA